MSPVPKAGKTLNLAGKLVTCGEGRDNAFQKAGKYVTCGKRRENMKSVAGTLVRASYKVSFCSSEIFYLDAALC